MNETMLPWRPTAEALAYLLGIMRRWGTARCAVRITERSVR